MDYFTEEKNFCIYYFFTDMDSCFLDETYKITNNKQK